jgi:hypothetical protein
LLRAGSGRRGAVGADWICLQRRWFGRGMFGLEIVIGHRFKVSDHREGVAPHCLDLDFEIEVTFTGWGDKGWL